MNKVQWKALEYAAVRLATASAWFATGRGTEEAVTEASNDLAELVDSMLEDAKKGQ